MRKDPTAFRERFKKWKETGEYELPRFEDGYEAFFNTLPENQKHGSYPTRRYWELNGKPKDFAEAVGKGMYTILNDNGTLNWHGGSIAYNENTDRYEFMKANYHPTRWMELVYGYDQSPKFLKDWKVLYNGPMFSDRYVRREKPGLKVKGGQLPKFEMGTEGIKKIYAPYYDSDGTLIRNVDVELPEIVVTGNKKDYTKLAEQERNRLRGMAVSYLKESPSIGNLYNAANAAWKSLTTSAADVNPYILTGVAPTPGIKTPAPLSELAHLRYQTYPRMFKGLSEEAYAKAVKEVERSIPKTYTKYKKQIPGESPSTAGVWDPNKRTIEAIGKQPFGHEGRHAIDSDWPLSKEEVSILRNAFNDDFLEYGNNNPLYMSREMVTSNFDIRKLLLKDANLEYAPLKELNEYLAGINMGTLRDAMLKANAYTKNYITKLSTDPYYTSNGWNKYVETLRNIKRSMQEVGSYVLPLAVGYGAYNKYAE